MSSDGIQGVIICDYARVQRGDTQLRHRCYRKAIWRRLKFIGCLDYTMAMLATPTTTLYNIVSTMTQVYAWQRTSRPRPSRFYEGVLPFVITTNT